MAMIHLPVLVEDSSRVCFLGKDLPSCVNTECWRLDLSYMTTFSLSKLSKMFESFERVLMYMKKT